MTERNVANVEPSSSFASLPDEIVLEIFKLLSVNDRLFRVSRVDRRFRILGFDSVTDIDYEKDLSASSQSVAHAKTLIGNCPKLVRLNMTRSVKDEPDLLRYDRFVAVASSDSTEIAIHALKSCPMLEELVMVLAKDSSLYDAVEEHGHSLRKLGVMTMGNTLRPKALAHLTHLSLSGLFGGETLLEVGKCCERLESLGLNRYTSRYTPQFTGMSDFLLSAKTTIKELRLQELMMTEEAYEALSQCHQLQVLKLHNACEMTAGRLGVVLGLPNLRELYIGGPCPRVKGMDYVRIFSEKKLGGLKKLTLNVGDKINDASLTAIAMSCPELLYLSISGQPATDLYMEFLHEIYPCKAPIGDNGLRSLMENCPKLEELKFDACQNLTLAGFANINKFLPNLKRIPISRCPQINVP